MVMVILLTMAVEVVIVMTMTMTTTSVQACDVKGRMHPILFVIEVCCGK